MVNKSSDPIDGYINRISSLLPYPRVIKEPVLRELREDVLDAIGDDKRPPSVVFGSPLVVARNISIAKDWGTKKASWVLRFLASIVDFILLAGVFLTFVLLRIVLTDFDEIYLFKKVMIPFGWLFMVIPVTLFVLSYFTIAEKTFSTTLGKWIFGLMVVDESGITLTWNQAVIRNFTKVPFITAFLPFDILLGIYSEKTRGRYQRVLDFVAGTNVVQKKR
ncbi:MAG: RDD family protein [Candidatus Hodarchaeales archaeon]|jgi:uncharacterized RDD family membrane protein YckC